MKDEATTRSPSIAVIGTGRLGRTLALALAARGESICAVAGRRPPEDLAERLGGACLATSAEAAVECAELVFLTVPDDAIAPLAAALPWTTRMRSSIAAGRPNWRRWRRRWPPAPRSAASIRCRSSRTRRVRWACWPAARSVSRPRRRR